MATAPVLFGLPFRAGEARGQVVLTIRLARWPEDLDLLARLDTLFTMDESLYDPAGPAGGEVALFLARDLACGEVRVAHCSGA